MKNLKKMIILSIIIIIIIIYLAYNYVSYEEEIIEENVYLETNLNIEKTNKIILHITGEVKNPRNYTNR